jgi:hypothetical protein
MMPYIQNSNDLLSSLAEGEYARLLAQLIKDFNRSNVAIDLRVELRPDQMRSILREKMYLLMMKAFDDYLSLMYVIDIPEKSFRGLRVTDRVEVADQVVFIILKRELQKIRFKAGSAG